MALPTFNLPGKNITADKQMAMMRTYLNQLKDDTESELYDIKWDNLSKPLKEKIEGLDKEYVQLSEDFSYIQANTVTTAYLQAHYLTADQISGTYASFEYLASDYMETITLNASQITAGTISTARLNVGEITAGCVNADLFEGNYIKAGYISASRINAGTLAAARIDAAIMRTSSFTADNISSIVSSSETATFGRINIDEDGMYIVTANQNKYKLTIKSVVSGGNTIYFLGTYTEPQ